jgi:hypothetical protein
MAMRCAVRADIFHGDTLIDEWDMLRETNPADSFSVEFAILGQQQRARPKPRRWADSIKRDFGYDPLLDKASECNGAAGTSQERLGAGCAHDFGC